jgi:hypothetical protein
MMQIVAREGKPALKNAWIRMRLCWGINNCVIRAFTCSWRLGTLIKIKCSVVLFMVMIVFAGCSGSGDSLTTHTLSLQMIGSAGEKIKAIDSDTAILWVGGRCADGQLLTDPLETDDWSFLADTIDNDNGEAAWEVHYDRAWAITDTSRHILGIVYKDMADVDMDICHAWQSAKQSGLASPFDSWELVQTLYPDIENPFFAFNTQDFGFVLVDTMSGKVWQDNQDQTKAFPSGYLYRF